MPGAQITIGVDGNSKIAVQFVGDESALLMLLGAIDYARTQVCNRIQMRTGEMMWGTVDGVTARPIAGNQVVLSDEQKAEYADEQKMPRDKAIEATEYAMTALQLRLDQMKKSPEHAEFLVNPLLLSKL